MQDINLQIEGFKRKLINDLNSANLPAAVIYYVVTDVYRNIEKEYFGLIDKLQSETQAENASENED